VSAAPTTNRVKRVVVGLEFEDGEQLEVVLKPVAIVHAERHFKGSVPAHEGTLYAAWWQLGREGKTTATFADWLDSLVGIEEHFADPSPAPPAAPSPTS